MPRKKKSEAAKVRINKQIRSNKGQFIINEDEYKPSDDYSEDSLDDEFINKRINKLNNFTLVWSNTNDIYTRKQENLIPEILKQLNIANMVLQEILLRLLN